MRELKLSELDAEQRALAMVICDAELFVDKETGQDYVEVGRPDILQQQGLILTP